MLDAQELKNRRRIGLLIRAGMVVVFLAILVAWFGSKRSSSKGRSSNVSVQGAAPAATDLKPGDVQIISTDGNIDITLQGDKLLAGLSPATVAKVKAEMDKEASNESGLGGVIAGAVKSGVASAIGMHFTYPVKDVQELRYVDRTIELVERNGKTMRLGDENNDKKGKRPAEFSKEDADRLIAAVNARKRELGAP